MSQRTNHYYGQLRAFVDDPINLAIMQIDRGNHSLSAAYIDDAVAAAKSVTERMAREGTMTTLIEHIRDKAIELAKLSGDLLSGNARGSRTQICSHIHDLYRGLFEWF